MPRLFYDLHIHSCLSPCADEDMTPNNIVNMALLAGCDMIALTDHNSCKNCAAAIRAGERAGLAVLPGMELCTAEEAHVICLFPALADALDFQEIVAERSVFVPNRPDIFGRQTILDADDAPLGEEENLLLNAVRIGVNEVSAFVKSCRGAAFPAHVDRGSYSVISSLGAIPPEAGFAAAEFGDPGRLEELCRTNPELAGLLPLFSSDAHTLERFAAPKAWLDLPEKTPDCLLRAVGGQIKAGWGFPARS